MRQVAPNARDIERTIQNARVAMQSMQMQANQVSRDTSMALNADRILKQSPEAKMVLWAYNEHVNCRGGAMGSLLASGTKRITYRWNPRSMRAGITRSPTLGWAPTMHRHPFRAAPKHLAPHRNPSIDPRCAQGFAALGKNPLCGGTAFQVDKRTLPGGRCLLPSDRQRRDRRLQPVRDPSKSATR